MKKDEIRIVYFGTPEFSAYILEELLKFCDSYSKKRCFVQAVITRADKPTGRNHKLESSAISKVADKYNISTLKPHKLNQQFIKDHATFLDCDLFIVASYGKIVPQPLLDIPKLGAINIHPSLLPKYRGPAPILTPILNGDKETGVTIMMMDNEMDHGDLLSSKVLELSEQDNNQTLTTKLAQISAEILTKTLVKLIEGKIRPTPQDHSKATYTKITKKTDGYFDINNPPSPEVLDRMIRAYHPWPGVWTKWNNKIIKLLPCHSERSEESRFLIQMEGKKTIPFKDFLNGYPNFPLKF